MNINLLRERKNKLNLSYDELSALSGVPKSTLTNIFMSRTPNPRIDTIQAIERALGLSSTFTDEDYAVGVTDKARIEVTVEEYEWLELRKEVIKFMGEEYLNTVKALMTSVVDKAKSRK